MILAEVTDNCIWCWKKFSWHEPIFGKYPEGAFFWLCFWEKYPDEKVYDWEKEWWIVFEYEPWLKVHSD